MIEAFTYSSLGMLWATSLRSVPSNSDWRDLAKSSHTISKVFAATHAALKDIAQGSVVGLLRFPPSICWGDGYFDKRGAVCVRSEVRGVAI